MSPPPWVSDKTVLATTTKLAPVPPPLCAGDVTPVPDGPSGRPQCTSSLRRGAPSEAGRQLGRRQELGLTKADLAVRANMPAAAIRRLFSQQQKNPTLVTLVAIADALDVSISVKARKDGIERSTPAAPRHRSASEFGTEAPFRTSGTRRRTA
jgi:hypothetical protein